MKYKFILFLPGYLKAQGGWGSGFRIQGLFFSFGIMP